MQETQEKRVQSLGWEAPLEKEMTTHSGILAWEILWIEEPGGLQPMESPKESDSTWQLNNNPSIQHPGGAPSLPVTFASRIRLKANTFHYWEALLE